MDDSRGQVSERFSSVFHIPKFQVSSVRQFVKHISYTTFGDGNPEKASKYFARDRCLDPLLQTLALEADFTSVVVPLLTEILTNYQKNY